MKQFITAVCLAALGVTGAHGAQVDFGDGIRMNQIQVLGTHNSYHKRPKSLGAMKTFVSATEDWDYEHLPLDQQLNNGIRSLELDTHNRAEGWQVFHLPMIDPETTCPTFQGCLGLVKEWSDAHPRHVPISLLIEFKDEGMMIDKRDLPLDVPALDRMDADVRAVFPAEKLITPDDVRGDFPTLEEAILKRGWPTLESGRSKVFVILHEDGDNRDLYLKDHASLKGRAMFVRSEPGRPEAATLVLDNPFTPNLDDCVRKGYWVRCTAGGHPHDGKVDTTRRDKAMTTGAHVLSSDYPPGEKDAATGYVVDFPGGVPARCNPVNAPPNCAGKALE